jgi:hypothetical protein
MTALSTLRFSGYTIRPANLPHTVTAGKKLYADLDLRLAIEWTAADPDHRGKIDPEFWLEQRPGMDSVVVEDQSGPVFFFKTCLLVERKQVMEREQDEEDIRIIAQVFIQFMPCATEEDRERTRQALMEGTAWLAPVLEQSGAEEMFFDTRQPKLIAFCQKRLGFIVDGKDLEGGYVRLRRTLQPRKPAEKMEGV